MSYVTIERSQRKNISLGHSLKFKFLENEKKLKLKTILNTQNLKRGAYILTNMKITLLSRGQM